MSGGSSVITKLPDILPVFAVTSAIVLPRGTIPLMVFEPRYLAMVDDALGAGRLFGLVQPSNGATTPVTGLCGVGTLARISAFGETGDGRYLITAQGVSRFKVIAEEAGRAGYRRVSVSYSGYSADLTEPNITVDSRSQLLDLVRTHLGGMDPSGEWEALDTLADDRLVDRLAMASPFSADEKQALLEAADHTQRCRLMVALFQRDLMSESCGTTLH